MKIMTFNVGIWTRNVKKSDPFYWKNRMKEMKKMLFSEVPDIICFQELWFPANLYIPKGYRKVLGTGFEHPIYVRKELEYNIGIFSIYWSMAKVENIRIFSIHGHWNKKRMERLCKNVMKIYTKDFGPSILAGDWNVEYKDLYKDTQLLNSARIMNNKNYEVTYIHFYDETRCGELDHILLYRCPCFNFKIIKNNYGNIRMSDHYPITVEV